MRSKSRQTSSIRKSILGRLTFGGLLLAFGASHGLTGLLANLGWYESLGINFDTWYMHPAYQSMCWFANGIALTILLPMWARAVMGRNRTNETTNEIIDENTNTADISPPPSKPA